MVITSRIKIGSNSEISSDDDDKKYVEEVNLFS